MVREYIIHPIPLFKIEDYPKAKMTWLMDFDKTITMAWYSWYVEGADKKIIVDPGTKPDSFIARGDKVTPIQTITQGLEKMGLKGDDIQVVIATHLHHDHFGLVDEFPNSEVIVQKTELEFARNPHPIVARAWPPDFQDMLERTHFRTVDGDIEIFDGIKVLFTPGHTPGGQSVAIRTSQGTAVITGFCSIRESFEPPAELHNKMPLIPPGIFLNGFQIYDSVAKIQKLADIIIPLHDPDYIHEEAIP